MRLAIWDDRRDGYPMDWSTGMLAEAERRGIDARRISKPDDAMPGDTVFVHMHLHPLVRERDKAAMHKLGQRDDIRLIPSPEDGRLYDDKRAQTEKFGAWLPPTWIFTDADEATKFAQARETWPIVSKTSEGAGSHNVRMLGSRRDALLEAAAVFNGHGLTTRYGNRQQGYVLWQHFCEGNAGDIRVVKVGRQRLILRRGNRRDRPMASGSGKLGPVVDLDIETASALEHADMFFRAAGTKWCAIDLVKLAGEWRVLEVSCSWAIDGYAGCAFFPDGRRGTEFWGMVIDEIEGGHI